MVAVGAFFAQHKGHWTLSLNQEEPCLAQVLEKRMNRLRCGLHCYDSMSTRAQCLQACTLTSEGFERQGDARSDIACERKAATYSFDAARAAFDKRQHYCSAIRVHVPNLYAATSSKLLARMVETLPYYAKAK